MSCFVRGFFKRNVEVFVCVFVFLNIHVAQYLFESRQGQRSAPFTWSTNGGPKSHGSSCHSLGPLSKKVLPPTLSVF